MTKNELYNSLQYVNHSRENRRRMAEMTLQNPSLIPFLFDIAFTVDDPISCRACWVLEFTSKAHVDWILPYLDVFLKDVDKVHLDPAVRPMAKICEYLIEAYYGKNPSEVKQVLKSVHLERITEVCFDWMITDQKVAVKAYSMRCLFLLGQSFDWIHPELRLILEQQYHTQTAAFKARTRHIIQKMEKIAAKKQS